MQLLERTYFLRTLGEYATEARQGDGRLVLVSGESGIGKTALLEAFQDEQPGTRWLWGACDGLFTPRPLGPLFDIGAQLDVEGGPLAVLCRHGAARDQMFSALLAELDTHTRFTVVVIEDLHWADEATIDLLSFVGRRLARRAALIIVTYRDDELAEDHPLRRALGDLATQRTTRRMRLAPLSEDALRTLAAGRAVDVAELRRITGGNPFYVREILDAGWPSIPPTVRDAVGARLARLTPDARAAAAIAAVMGARLDSLLLSSALDDLGAPVVAECLASGLLVFDGNGLRFRHELARLAVESAITPGRKTELHARLLTALEQNGAGDSAVLAHHAEGAGDREAVLRHAPDAARRSSMFGAHRESAAQYERALRFADDLDAASLAALHEGIAREYSLLDRWEDAELALRVALRLRRELGDDSNVGQNLQMLAATLWRLCRGDESRRAAEEASKVLLQHGSSRRELGWAYAARGVAQLMLGQTDDGTELIGRAQEIGEQLDLPDLVSYSLNGLGFELMRTRGVNSIQLLERALQIGLDREVPEAAGRAYGSLEEACISLQQFAQAERYYAEGMAFCDGRELGVFSLCLMGWRTVALLLLGRWTEAEELCTYLLNKRRISPINKLNPLCVLATIKGRRGEAAAWELLDEATAKSQATGEPQWILAARAVRAELRWLSGHDELAIQEARAGYQEGLGRVDPWTLGQVAIWLARLQGPDGMSADLPEPYALEVAGHRTRAARAWDTIGRTYDAALVLLQSSDEQDLRQAICTFDNLGAEATSACARRRMRELGIGNIPRGPRPSTRSALGGLTVREQEVLALLTEGLQDKEIARRLVISERTVHHHVSAILSKFGVTSRSAAAREAVRMGIEAPI